MARVVLAETRVETQRRSLDVAGALTVTGGLVALVYAIVRTDVYAWTSVETLVPLAIAAVLLGLFLRRVRYHLTRAGLKREEISYNILATERIPGLG